MRRWRSFLATTSSAPSSIFLRPIFQVSATRSENCSIASPSVVGTISTAIWLPLRASKFLKVWFSEAASPPLSVPVWSTTRPTSGGTATLARARLDVQAGKTQHSNSASRMALAAFMTVNSCYRLFRRGRRWVEIDLRRGRDRLLVVDREVRLFLAAEHHCRQIVRKSSDADIVVLHRLDIAVARHGDAVFGTF